MAINLDKYLAEKKLIHLAKDAIEKFTEISSLAASQLSQNVSFNTGVFANPSQVAFNNLRGITNSVYQANRKLMSEPAVGRVVIHFTNTGQVEEYYICKATPPTGSKNLIIARPY